MRRFGAGKVMHTKTDQIQRQQIHGIHEEHPHEDGQCERCNKTTIAMEHVLDLAIDELEHDLDKGLRLRWHPSGGLACQQPEPQAEDQADTQAGGPGVKMHRTRAGLHRVMRSEEHTSELQSLMRNSYA